MSESQARGKQKKNAQKNRKSTKKKPAMVRSICRLSYNIKYLSKKAGQNDQTPFAHIQITIPF